MQSIGAFDAKTHFSALLLKVEQGEKFIITKHGNEVAMLVPIEQKSQTILLNLPFHLFEDYVKESR